MSGSRPEATERDGAPENLIASQFERRGRNRAGAIASFIYARTQNMGEEVGTPPSLIFSLPRYIERPEMGKTDKDEPPVGSQEWLDSQLTHPKQCVKDITHCLNCDKPLSGQHPYQKYCNERCRSIFKGKRRRESARLDAYLETEPYLTYSRAYKEAWKTLEALFLHHGIFERAPKPGSKSDKAMRQAYKAFHKNMETIKPPSPKAPALHKFDRGY
jgi:predicted nucleic acid-binding Zn ribbon protein